MFEGREEALEHRDAVLEVLQDVLDPESADDPFHIHPVLDGAVVRIEDQDLDAVKSTLEDHGFGVTEMGESKGWFELKVKP